MRAMRGEGYVWRRVVAVVALALVMFIVGGESVRADNHQFLLCSGPSETKRADGTDAVSGDYIIVVNSRNFAAITDADDQVPEDTITEDDVQSSGGSYVRDDLSWGMYIPSGYVYQEAGTTNCVINLKIMMREQGDNYFKEAVVDFDNTAPCQGRLWLNTARDPNEDAAVCPEGAPADTPGTESGDTNQGGNSNNNPVNPVEQPNNGGTPGNNNGGTPGNNNGGTPGNNNGGTPGNNNGGTPGNNNGGTPGNNNGGTPGNNNGGTPGNNNGGTPGNNNGGTPGNNNGGTPGNNNGGTPGNNDGGTPSSDDGTPSNDDGTPSNDDGGTPSNDDGATPGDNDSGTPGDNDSGTPGDTTGGDTGGGTTPGGSASRGDTDDDETGSSTPGDTSEDTSTDDSSQTDDDSSQTEDDTSDQSEDDLLETEEDDSQTVDLMETAGDDSQDMLQTEEESGDGDTDLRPQETVRPDAPKTGTGGVAANRNNNPWAIPIAAASGFALLMTVVVLAVNRRHGRRTR